MRRPSVHRVEFGPTRNIVIDPFRDNSGGDIVQQLDTYRTRCGITGGAELLKLAGTNNGAGRWCGGCYPSSIIDPRSTSRWESRWTRG